MHTLYTPVQLANAEALPQQGTLNCQLHTVQVLFRDNKFQWKRLQNLIQLAKEGTGDAGLDLSDTLSDGARMVFLDPRLRQQLIMALTEDNRLHIQVGSWSVHVCVHVRAAVAAALVARGSRAEVQLCARLIAAPSTHAWQQQLQCQSFSSSSTNDALDWALMSPPVLTLCSMVWATGPVHLSTTM